MKKFNLHMQPAMTIHTPADEMSVTAFLASNGSIQATKKSQQLLFSIGGVPGLESMTYIFYTKFFADQHLRQFLGDMHTPLEVHAKRIALYIAEMMGAADMPWTLDTKMRSGCPAVHLAGGRSVRVDSRSNAHVAAWYSVTRKPEHVGRRFKLDDCRVWMRLMFWAMRESGLADDEAFADYFQRWVGHFIPIYEQTARVFVRHEFRWSANAANLTAYVADGNVMLDVIGVPLAVALRSVPAAERDSAWPYG